LKNPSEKFFYEKKFEGSEIRKKARKGEFLRVVLETNRQEGDIAGTKMKKFSGLLERVLGEYFTIVAREFFYKGEGSKSEFYLVLKSKKEILKVGPPLDMKEDVERFKKANKKNMKKNGAICSRIKVDFSGKEFLEKWLGSKDGRLKLDGMGISGLKIEV